MRERERETCGDDVSLISAPGGSEPLLSLEVAARNHVLREALRHNIWRRLAISRPSFGGVEDGVDTVLTNDFWQSCGDPVLAAAMRCIIVGGVFLADRWGRNKLGAATDSGPDGPEAERSTAPTPPPVTAADHATATADGDAAGDTDDDDDSSSSAPSEFDVLDDSGEVPLPLTATQPEPGSDRLCRNCDTGSPETVTHLFWECPAHNDVRARERYAGLCEERLSWPPCLANWGIIPKPLSGTVRAKDLHHLMSTIVARRDVLERERLGVSPTVCAWDAALARPAAPHQSDLASLPDNPPRWTHGECIMRALRAWLGRLTWTREGSISFCELAIDFEVFSGLDVCPIATGAPAGTQPAPLNMRGRMMGQMLKYLVSQCEAVNLRAPLPGAFVSRVYCLRAVGVKEVWGGLEPRPRFACHGLTTRILIEQIPRAIHWASSKSWGLDLTPSYTEVPDRDTRSEQWDPTPVAPTRDPLDTVSPRSAPCGAERYAPRSEVLARNVCRAHSKPKCHDCDAAGHNRTLRMEDCCRAHHRQDDGLPVQFCSTHRLLRCGTCSSSNMCCKRGHHGCRDHDLPPCGVCASLPELDDRRPTACCKKGHHVPPAPATPVEADAPTPPPHVPPTPPFPEATAPTVGDLPSTTPPRVPAPQPSPEATPCPATPEPATPPVILKRLAHTVCSPGSPHRHLMQPRRRLSPDGVRPSIPAVAQLKRTALEAHTGSTPALPAQRPRVDHVIPTADADADVGAADPDPPSPTTSPPDGVSVDAALPQRPRSGASSSSARARSPHAPTGFRAYLNPPSSRSASPGATDRVAPAPPPPPVSLPSPHQSSSSLKQGESTGPRARVVK